MKGIAFGTQWLIVLAFVSPVLGTGFVAAQPVEVIAVEVIEETSEHRLVRHPGGETRVPANPQRVAILHPSFSDTAVALGVQPISERMSEKV